MKQRLTILIAFMACLLLMPTEVSAQQLRIKLYHTDKESKRKVAAQNVSVYSFLSPQKAKDAQDKLKEFITPNKRSGQVAEGKTNKAGEVVLYGRPDGFLLIDAINYIPDYSGAILLQIEKLNPKSDENGLFYDVEYLIPDAETKSGNGDMTRNLADSVRIVAQTKGIRKPSTKAIQNGTTVTFKTKIYIDSLYARNDARFVVSPYLIVPAENNDTIGWFTPHVVDGKDYEETMLRKMNYDHSHDQLLPYRESEIEILDQRNNVVKKSPYMLNRKHGMFRMEQTIYDFDFTRHYNAAGFMWYEDYNHIYHKETRRLWPGNFIQYNRYLDWKSARADVEINPENYYREATDEAKPDSASYLMTFEVGKAQLNMNDSSTISEIARLKANIDRVYNATDDSRMTSATIVGYASPEGGLSSNMDLAKRRAQHLYETVLRPAFPDYSRFPMPKFDARVAPWTEAADTLRMRNDSVSQHIADEIMEICNSVKGIEAQGRIISQRPWYKTIVLPEILPRLRRDKFMYETIVYDPLTPDEIFQKYQNDPVYHEGKRQRDYEFYELMQRLYADKDYEGLERIARQAYAYEGLMEDVTRRDTIGSKMVQDSLGNWYPEYILKPESPVFSRPYPLAAYYIAMCLLKRGAVDVHLLPQFLDYSHGGRPYLKKDPETQDERGYWNDEAIVLAQVMMLCQANDFTRANLVMDEHLPENDPRFSRLRVFLRALKGEYNDPIVRDTVAVSSPMNFLVAWCGYADAVEDPTAYRMAMHLIENDMEPIIEKYPYIEEQWEDQKLDNDDPRVMYVKAICRYKTECPLINQDEDSPMLQSTYIYDDMYPERCWAADMLNACIADPSNAKFLETDGNFNDAYRTLVLYFYQRHLQGATMPDIAKEYDKLRQKYAGMK